jgi:hypothetical protein
MRPASIVTACLLATLAGAAPAHAATVSPAGVRFPQLAVNARGATVVAWERKTKDGFAIEVRSGSGPLELGRTQRLARVGRSPRVAIGRDGTRAVQWLEDAGRGARAVRVAIARPGHGFGPGQLLERREANMATVAVAVQRGGRVVSVWARTTGRVGYALAPRNRAFGRPRDLTTTGPISESTITLDPRDGAVVLAYGTPLNATPPTNQQAAARALSTTATTFSAPVVVSDPSGLAEAHPYVATGSGATGVAYTQSGETPSLRIARREADGTWAPPEVIADPVYGADVFAVGLRATLPADGSALAAWSISTEPGGRGPISEQTVASIAAPPAPFGAVAEITPAKATFDALAVASAGDEAFLATAKVHGPVVLATRYAGSRILLAPVRLASKADGDVLLAAAGKHVLAAWQKHDRLNVHVVR